MIFFEKIVAYPRSLLAIVGVMISILASPNGITSAVDDSAVNIQSIDRFKCDPSIGIQEATIIHWRDDGAFDLKLNILIPTRSGEKNLTYKEFTAGDDNAGRLRRRASGVPCFEKCICRVLWAAGFRAKIYHIEGFWNTTTVR